MKNHPLDQTEGPRDGDQARKLSHLKNQLTLPLIPNAQGRLVIPFDHFINNDLEYLKGGSASQNYTTSITKMKAADYGQVKWIEDRIPIKMKAADYGQVKWIEDRIPRTTWSMVPIDYDKHAYWGRYHWGPKHQRMSMEYTPTWKFQGYIEDMLLLLVQGKLTNLSLDDRYALNVALRMYTRRIVIQERVEDLQLAVKSYQKKINLTRPDTTRPDLRKMTPYTGYPDVQGIIYQDKLSRNRLMRTDELHKFSDGTLNHVRTTLNDIATGIQMDYFPKRRWSPQDKRRARVMISAIDRKLRDRRLMRSLEKFVGGRPINVSRSLDEVPPKSKNDMPLQDKMDDPNITIEEYIRLEEEKAQKHGKVFKWETAKYGKIWYNEDIHDLRSVETKFPAIAFNDGVSSEKHFLVNPR
ncbi:hypothetical protein Tco_0681964 [Tanacetum coccineum]|uniref:Uncharacterized protein n=1 Tax=Tanacetum coccineum TaxID=301880 RepID=A0ABQ4XQY9_9ASTR